MLVAPSTSFSEFASIAAWLGHLDGLSALPGFHQEGRSAFVTSSWATPPRSQLPAVPRVLPREAAPAYEYVVPDNIRGIMQWSFMSQPFGEFRVIARDLDLLSALMFLPQADLRREYAIEEEDETAGLYRIVSGSAYQVPSVNNMVVHTHKDGIALPSENDLEKLEGTVVHGLGKPWTTIYSRPGGGHQFSYIERLAPRSFEIWLWQQRGRTASVRHFNLRSGQDRRYAMELGIVDEVQVWERDLAGRLVGSGFYSSHVYPERNIQEFWADVLAGFPAENE